MLALSRAPSRFGIWASRSRIIGAGLGDERGPVVMGRRRDVQDGANFDLDAGRDAIAGLVLHLIVLGLRAGMDPQPPGELAAAPSRKRLPLTSGLRVASW